MPIASQPIRQGVEPRSLLAGLLLVLTCLLLRHPYEGIWHDSTLYLGQVLAILHPEAFRHDLFFAYGSQASYTVFPRVLAALLRHFTPDAVFFWFSFVGLALFALASWLLLRALMPPAMRLPALLAVIVLPAGYGTWALLSYAEPFLTGRTLSEPLVLASIALLLCGRHWFALFAWIMAASLHPLQALPALVFGWVWLVQQDRRWLHALWLVPIALAACLVLPPLGFLTVRMDALWFEQVWKRNLIVFYSNSGSGEWFYLLADVFVAGVAAHKATGRLRGYFIALLAASVLLFTASLLLADVLRFAWPAQLQLWRVHWLLHWSAMAVLPWLCVAIWRGERAHVQPGIAGTGGECAGQAPHLQQCGQHQLPARQQGWASPASTEVRAEFPTGEDKHTFAPTEERAGQAPHLRGACVGHAPRPWGAQRFGTAWPRVVVFVATVALGLVPAGASPAVPGGILLYLLWPRLCRHTPVAVQVAIAAGLGMVALAYLHGQWQLVSAWGDLLAPGRWPRLPQPLVPIILFVAAFAGLPLWKRLPSAMRSVAVLLLVATFVHAAGNWDRRTHLDHTFTGIDGTSSEPVFGVTIQADEQVLWLPELLPAWSVLHRSNYIDMQQLAGIVFNRETSIEGYRRLALMHVTDGSGKDCRIVVSRRDPYPPCHTPDDVAVSLACERAQGQLTYFVLPYRLEAEPHGQWSPDGAQGQHFYLYACRDMVATLPSPTQADAGIPP